MERHNTGTEKNSNCQPRLVYPAKLSFLIEGEITTFHNKGIYDYQASTMEDTLRTFTYRRRN
jgi:hypothetical protein